MSFVYPYFLFALSAISIPIIVHLFNFRKYKRIYFSDVSFLKEVKLQTQAVNKLKHLLILIARILTITFLVLAFAQPYFPLTDNKINAGNKTLSIFIDNSFSMEALNTNGSLLEQAKKNAKEIAMAYSPSDKFQLLSQDFEAKHQRLVNRETFLEWLSEIKISASSNSFKDIVTRQKDALKNSDSKTKNAFIISDFQKSNFTFNELNTDTSTFYQLNPVAANKPANVYIDSCWFSTPARQQNTSEELTVKICNQSEQTIENIPIKLSINKQQRAISSATLNANECKEIKINFVSSGTGIQNGTLEITDFPITYDDKFYFSYTVISKINVLSIESSDYSSAPKQLYTSDSLFNFVSVNEKNIDYSSLKNFNVVILNNVNSLSTGLAQELQKFVSNNGSLLIFPGIKAETESYNNFLQRTIQVRFSEVDTVDSKTTTLNYKHPFFANVFEKNPEKIDLPKISNHYSIISTSRSNNEKLLSFANGTPFLSISKFNKGKIYVCASALNNDFSNFEKHSLLVPVLYKIALNSVSEQNLYSTINNNNTIELKANETNSDNVFRITNMQNTFDVIPEIKINNEYINLFLHNQIKEAGHYSIKNSKNEINSAIAFNYNRSESKFEFYTDDELINEIDKNSLTRFSILKSTEKSLTAVLKEINEGIKLWKYCLLAALAFIAAEIILIRFWKT